MAKWRSAFTSALVIAFCIWWTVLRASTAMEQQTFVDRLGATRGARAAASLQEQFDAEPDQSLLAAWLSFNRVRTQQDETAPPEAGAQSPATAQEFVTAQSRHPANP